MSNFKKPDLNAPRFRPKTSYVLKKKFYDAFYEKYPEHKDKDKALIETIINTYNGEIWKGAIENRDGVELPENLGYLLITRCDRPRGDNIDYASSIKYGQRVNHRNWESDNYLAKICYTNYSLKYRFADRELWGFTAVKQFKQAVSNQFAKNYNKYIHLGEGVKLSRLYKNS